MNKDFAAWWLAERPKFFVISGSDTELGRLTVDLCEATWNAAVKTEELKRQQAGGPG